LLKIGNYQLLRYRVLDQSIEEMLDKINERFFQTKRPRATRGLIRQIAEHRLEVMLDFERTDQNLLLIGDWYTAKLYEAIQNEFYLKDWKESVRAKLDNLENIVETIQENFSLSWETLMDRLQLLGWVLLLVGYIYLYFLDAGWVVLP
jgi:predicted GIY-YIG superfamily endonuclease